MRARAIHHELLKETAEQGPLARGSGPGSVSTSGGQISEASWAAGKEEDLGGSGSFLLPSPIPIPSLLAIAPSCLWWVWWTRRGGHRCVDSLGLRWEGGKGQRIYGCGSVGAWALEGQTVLAFGVQLSFGGPVAHTMHPPAGQGGRAGGLRCPWSPSAIMTRPANGGGSDWTRAQDPAGTTWPALHRRRKGNL